MVASSDTDPVRAVVTAGTGFLVAVVWFDLMFDVQVLRFRTGAVPEPVLASIAGYYRRVTTDARPMNRLVAAAMVATLAALVAELAGDDVPDWVAAASLVLAASAMGLAGARTVRNAVRLGARADAPEAQADLARSIAHDHLYCLGAMTAVLVVQLAFGGG
jgi:hypothetical protein